MNNTIQALQGLYIKMGGSLTDTYDAIANGVQVGNYTTIPNMIEACTQLAGSGGEVLVVTITKSGNTYTMNRTFKQIRDAYVKGKPMFAKFDNVRMSILSTDSDSFGVVLFMDNSLVVFDANNETDYPAYNNGEL